MSSSTGSSAPQKRARWRIRGLLPTERSAIESILRRTGAFSQDEVDCALSLVDSTFDDPDQADPYRFAVAVGDDDVIVGYACWGTSPMTKGTYDLYWIATDPGVQGGGSGRALLAHVEDDVRRAEGRMLLIETSSRDDYGKTQHFYEKCGYSIEVRLKDYYSVGDDKLVYVKRFSAS